MRSAPVLDIVPRGAGVFLITSGPVAGRQFGEKEEAIKLRCPFVIRMMRPLPFDLLPANPSWMLTIFRERHNSCHGVVRHLTRSFIPSGDPVAPDLGQTARVLRNGQFVHALQGCSGP